MLMKKILLIIAAMCLMPALYGAKQKPVHFIPTYEKATFKEYAKHMQILYEMCITPPDGFKETKYFGVGWTANPDDGPGVCAGDFLGPSFFSKDGECLVLYAFEPVLMSRFQFPSARSVAKSEIESTLMGKDGRLPSYRLEDYLSVVPTLESVTGLRSPTTDSIYIYTIPNSHKTQFSNDKLESLKESHFPHCIGVYITYLSRIGLHFKMYLSDEGLKNKDMYIDRVLRGIRTFSPRE